MLTPYNHPATWKLCCTGADPGFLEKGVGMYNDIGGRFADFISFFLNIPWKGNNLVSLDQIISFS